MIPFKCQSCGQGMSVPDSMAGQFEACPVCSVLVPVPGPYKPEVPASWLSPRAGSANAVRLQQARGSARNLIWGFSLAALVFAVLGVSAPALAPWSIAEALWLICMICMGLCAVVAFAAMPGAIARSRGLANADGINILGVLGVFIPVVWLVALIMALLGTPQAGSHYQGD